VSICYLVCSSYVYIWTKQSQAANKNRGLYETSTVSLLYYKLTWPHHFIKRSGWGFEPIKLNSTPPVFFDVSVSSQDNDRAYICVLMIVNVCSFLRIFYMNLELVRQRVIVYFSLYPRTLWTVVKINICWKKTIPYYIWDIQR
jgi:hypothetical protein